MAKSFFFDNELGEIRLGSLGDPIILKGGPADAGTNGQGGGVTIQAQTGGTGEGAGGDILIQSGDPGSAVGGPGRASGNITLQAGTLGDIAAISQGGGDITLQGGNSGSNSNQAAGKVVIKGGNAYSTGANAGDIEIRGGSGWGNGAGGVAAKGGDIIVEAGDAGSLLGGGGPYSSLAGTVSITAGSTKPGNTAAGGAITVTAGSAAPLGTAVGGALTMRAGSGPGGGGATSIKAGDAHSLGGSGGNIEIKAGKGSAGGTAALLGGSSDGAAGGAVTVRGGHTDTGTTGGDLNLRGGDFLNEIDVGAATRRGGDVTIRSGREVNPPSESDDNSAGIFLEHATGPVQNAASVGGKIEIVAGIGAATGGDVLLKSGGAENGVGLTNGQPGNVNIQAGNGGGGENTAGAINLQAGTPNDAKGGNIVIHAGSGNGAANEGGDVTIQAGSALASGDGGSVFFLAGKHALDHNPGYFSFRNAQNETTGVELRLYDESHNNYIGLAAPDGNLGSDLPFIFPVNAGAGGQFLTTDGLGNLNWGNPASVSASGGGQIQSDGSYAPEGGAGLGVGQTWTGSNLAGSTRNANTTYTNNSTCPIAVAITFATGNDTNSSIIVNGVEVAKWDVEGLGATYYRTLYAVIPAGQSYVGYVRGSAITYWTEMTSTGACGSPGGLGVNQAWSGQSRALNTAYTNNSGYPIAVSVKLGVANGALATLRVSNSGAPGVGDEVDQFQATTIGNNAGDNFITLFGIIPNGGQYDIATTGSVVNYGWYELRGPTPVNGGGLGVGQTWSGDLGPTGAATRAANTAYENTDSCPRHIQVRLNGITDTRVQTGATAGSLTDVSRQDPGGVSVTNHSVVFTVPAGRFYRITTTDTVTSWQEMSGGTCSAAALTKIIDADLDTYVRVAETATGDQDRIDMQVGDNSGDYDVTNPIMQLSTAGVTIEVPDGQANNVNGGSVTIEAGDGDGTGTGGAIFLQPGYGGGGAPSIPTGTGIPEPTELWFVDGQGTPGYVGFKAPDTVVTNTVWTLPDDDGPNGNEVLITDGSGVLSWATNSTLRDADGDTLIQVEESNDEDTIRIDLGDSPTDYGAVPNALVMSSAGLTVSMGTATGTNTVGAPISMTAGNATGTGDGGSVNLTAGNGITGTGKGGDVNIQAGDGITSGSGAGFGGGTVRITAGTVLGTGFWDAGKVLITGGSGGTSSSDGGAVTIRGGVPGTGEVNTQGGNIAILGGEPASGNTGSGGDITLLGGQARGAIDALTGRPGGVNIYGGGGDAAYDGSGGDVLIRGGGAGAAATAGETGGDITLISGSANPSTGVAAGGLVRLQTGSSRGIGEFNGPILLTAASHLYDDPAHMTAIYVEGQTGHFNDWPMELRFMQGGGQAISPYNLAEWVSLRAPVESTDINDVILSIRNTAVGNVTDSAAGTSGFTVTKVTEGSLSEPEVTHLNCLPAASLTAAGPSDYWTFNDGTTSYYVWYQNGTSNDPVPGGTGIQVTLGGAETAKGVAQATETAINGSAANTLARVIPGVILTLPASPGSSGQVLTTDGGNPATMSWASVGSGTLTFPLLANPNGTAGAPAYSFNGKATVGMYSAAANTIGFSTNGVQRVTVDNNALTLYEDTGAELELRFRDGTDGTYVGLKAPDNVTTQTVWALPVADGGTDGEVLATDGAGQLKFQKMEYIYSSNGTAATTHAISHNLNQQYVTYTIWDRATNQRINNAATETATSANVLTLTFTVAQDIIVAIMGVPGLGVNT